MCSGQRLPARIMAVLTGALVVLVGQSATANIDAGPPISHDIRKSNKQIGRHCGRHSGTQMRQDLAGRQTRSLSKT